MRCPWAVVNQGPPWAVVCGPRAVVRGPRAVVRGPRAVVRGPRAVIGRPPGAVQSEIELAYFSVMRCTTGQHIFAEIGSQTLL